MNELKPLLSHTCLLGEGPVWDGRNGRLLWVDILRGEVHQYHPETGAHGVVPAGEMVGAVALRKAGGLVAALQSGFAFLEEETPSIGRIADPEAQLPGNRFNDGKCDPQGRFWAGTMSLQDEPGAGGLYMLDAKGGVHPKISGVSISNGLAWSADGRTFYYIDTPTLEVAAYDFDGATGEISNRRVAIRIPEDFGDPDGMTIDTEGMLWIAHWDGWQVTRWDPRSAEQLMKLPVPAARVTSCTFGGPGLRDLFITTARTGLSAEQIAAQPLAGAVFVLEDCGYTGHPAVLFAG